MLLEPSAALDLPSPSLGGSGSGRGTAAGPAARRVAPADPRTELPARLTALATMSRDELVLEWRRLFRANPPDRIRRELLELGIAWKLQEKVLGGLKRAITTELRGLADALATTGDIRWVKTPKLKPRARLVREWGGVTHEVTVVDGGFLWNGAVRKSLSAIAEEITGAHWSGPRFFGLASRAKPVAGASVDGIEENADA
jgi:hypothetical protein